MKINQGTAFLNMLLKDVRAGNLMPAAFQRPYVWSRADVLALCESIIRGYPIGAFLVWSPWGKADLSTVARERLGPVIAPEASKWTSMLLDGQNRLATLAWMGLDHREGHSLQLTENEMRVWGGVQLVANLETHQLEFLPSEQAHIGFTLPSCCIVDPRLTNAIQRERWNREWGHLSDEAKDTGLRWFDKVERAFMEARIVYTEMQDATAEEAKEAFLHICKVGVPMSAEDFERSMSWAFQPSKA